ncbi:MAG: thioredoxin fold domain-containing protein [bacterium]|nr:thioredoxin fold domain-containing protein [bacterium]
MKKKSIIYLLLIVLLLFYTVSCSSNIEDKSKKAPPLSPTVKVNFEKGSLNEALAKAAKNNLPVMVDVYSKNCGACKRISQEVFDDSETATFFNKRFVNIKINGNEGEGVEFRKKFRVKGYPTVIILKPNAEELDRICGFPGKEEFIKTITDFADGKNTLPAILAELEEAPDSVEINMKLGKRYADRWEAEKANLYFVKVLKLDPSDEKGFKSESMYMVSAIEYWAKKNIEPLKSFVTVNTDKRFFKPSYDILIRFYTGKKEFAKAAEMYEVAISKLSEDTFLMNDYAWYIYKNRLKDKYPHGIELAKKVLETRPDAANVWDTLAWLYYEHGDKQKALESIKKAVEFSSEAKKIKFQERLEKIEKGIG